MYLYFSLLVVSAVLVNGEIYREHIHTNNNLTMDIFTEMIKDYKSNFVYSTASLEVILNLLYSGAEGETADQIQKALTLPKSKDTVKDLIKAFFTEIKQIEGPELIMANKIYLAKGVQVKPEFMTTAKEIFRAGVENVDFNNSVESTNEINSWVEKETHNRIQKVIDEGQISELTRMILVNTLYLKALFKHPFNPQKTAKMDFHLLNNQTIQVDTMELTQHLHVHKNEEHKITIVQIPYVVNKGNLRLSLALPHGDLKKLIVDLKPIGEKQRGNYKKHHVKIFVPKFRIETSIKVKTILRNMGITKLFSAPDLSGITDESIQVNAINQKIFLDVNEQGTEAAAATAAIADSRIIPAPGDEPEEIHFNRPFLFSLMYDELTLISGRVMDPLEK